jgi:hypothetical protein
MSLFKESVRHRQCVIRVPVQNKTWEVIDSGGHGSDLMHAVEESGDTESRFYFYIPRLASLNRIIGSGDRFETLGHKTGFRHCVVRKGCCLQDDQSCRMMSCSFAQVLTAFSAQMSGDVEIFDSRDRANNHFLVWDKAGRLLLATFSVEAKRWRMCFHDPFASSTHLWPNDRILYPAPV